MSDLPGALEAVAQRWPERTALQTDTSSTTYAELWARVQQAELLLSQTGIAPGQYVGLLLLNEPAGVTVLLALALLGAHTILLGPGTPPAELETLQGAVGALPILSPGLLLGRFAAVPTLAPALVDIDALLAGEPPARPASPATPERQGHICHYTSGTTDLPKVVIQSQQSLINGARIYCATYRITADDVLLAAVPLSHSFGLVAGLAATLLAGARLLLLERFVPAQVLDLLERERVTLLIGTPRVYELLLSVPPGHPQTLPALRVALSSGSPVPRALGEHFARRFGALIYEVYGSTETGVIAAQWPRADGWPAFSVGKLLDGVRMRIIGESGGDVPPGGTGLLLVQTPAMFLGYLTGPHRGTTPQPWYETGDLAWQNSDGDLFLAGRGPLLITHNGQTINPLEIEAVLLSHPQVAEALVYANGQLCAAVVAEGQVTADELVALCRTHLGPAHVPESLIFVSELPRGELGKLRRIASGIRSL
ncbi:MAG: acyl-CoA synthetase [Roseiflexaceae bacterium]